MKKLILILIISITTSLHAQFIDKDYTQFSIWVDPTLTDNGFQTGIELTKIMHWGFASVSTSVYDGLDVRYVDAVGTLGINFHLFDNDVIRYYGGLRLGRIWRGYKGDGSYPLAGGVIGADIRLSKFYTETQFHIGVRLWTDYREDQKAQFYGDYDAYKPGVITNNPLLQENGAIVLSISW